MTGVVAQLQDRGASRLGGDRLGFHPTLRPRAETGDHQRHRDQQDSYRQRQLHSGMTAIFHGSTTADEESMKAKSGVNGVHDSNIPEAEATTDPPVIEQLTTSPSDIRPPSKSSTT